MRRPALLLVLLLALAAPARAEAVNLKIGLGANYWLAKAGVFNIDLAITVPLASVIAVGGRAGIALTTSPTAVGIPLDILLQIRPAARVYIDILGGPWPLFGDGATVRGHFAAGVGLKVGPVSFGPEVGYLDPDGIIGMRLAIGI